MAKKIKKYVDGGDVYEGTPLARAMGVRGVAEPGLEEVYPEQYMGGVGSIKGVGGSAMKAVRPKKFNQKDVADILMQSEAEAQARFAANRAAREAAAQDYAKNRALEAAKDQQRRALKKANMAGKEPPVREGRVNPYVMQEPGVSYRPLDHKDVMRYMGEFKKGGAVKAKAKPKASSASKRADGCAIKGKTKGRMV